MDSHDLSKRVVSEETHTGDNTNFDGMSDNDDDEDNKNSEAAASDEAPKRQLLVSSASVPMFKQTENDDSRDTESKPPSEFGGSETDLSRGDVVNQTSLQMSQSYAGPDRGHHKVQFVENSSHHVSFSPIRKTKSQSPS